MSVALIENCFKKRSIIIIRIFRNIVTKVVLAFHLDFNKNCVFLKLYNSK